MTELVNSLICKTMGRIWIRVPIFQFILFNLLNLTGIFLDLFVMPVPEIQKEEEIYELEDSSVTRVFHCASQLRDLQLSWPIETHHRRSWNRMPVQLILLDSRTIGVTRLSISFLLLCVLNLVTLIKDLH